MVSVARQPKAVVIALPFGGESASFRAGFLNGFCERAIGKGGVVRDMTVSGRSLVVSTTRGQTLILETLACEAFITGAADASTALHLHLAAAPR